MKSILSTIIALSLLSGCSSIFSSDQGSETTTLEFNEQQAESLQSSTLNNSLDFRNQAQHVLHGNQQQKKQLILSNQQVQPMVDKSDKAIATQGQNKNINYYMRGLMQDLVGNLQYVNNRTPLAVSSFVMLDSDYTQSNLLGIQISESLLHEVHKFGIPVIDFKTTNYIRVTEQGDLSFSKDFLELASSSPVRYIVGGTLLKYNNGYLVNARIVGVESKAVVASAQSFIPGEVANAVLGNSSEIQPIVTSEAKMPIPLISIIQG